MLKPPGPEYIEPDDQPIAFDLLDMQMEDALTHVRKGAYWLYAIGVLSILDIFLRSKNSYFMGGLAFPGMLEELFFGKGAGDQAPHYVILQWGTMVFFVLGYFGIKRKHWAFIVGAIVYVFDALCYVYLGDWFAVSFHLFVLVNLYRGFQTLRKYETLAKSKGAVQPKI